MSAGKLLQLQITFGTLPSPSLDLCGRKMENSSIESEEIFNSLNLNPRLFINESHNLVDDTVDGAFHYFHREASNLLGTDQDADRSDDLKKGVEQLKITVQSVLDKRLSMWERYCLAHCFSLPDGFSLPKDTGSASDCSTDLNIQRDRGLDEQLDSLRNEISSVIMETAERNKELRAQKRKSGLNSQLASSVGEASQLYEQHSDMLEELTKAAAELRKQMKQQKAKRLKQAERGRIERISVPTGDAVGESHVIGLFGMTVEELKDFVADIKNQ